MKNELTEATDAWETQRYEDSGSISKQTLVGGVGSDLTTDDVRYLLRGFRDGFAPQQRDTADIYDGCMYFVPEIYLSFTKAVSNYSYRTKEGALQALHELSYAVEIVQSILLHCGLDKKVGNDLKKAWETVSNANNFKYFRPLILIKDFNIAPELDKAMANWPADTYEAGRHLGLMYNQVLTKTGLIGEAAVAVQQPEYTISEDITVDDGEMKNELTEATDAWETQRYEDFSSQFGLVSDQTLIGGVDPQHIALWLVRGICDKFAQGYRAICLDLHLRCIREQWAPKIYLSFKEAANQYAAETEEGDLRALEELSSAMMLVQTLFFYCITSSPKVAIFSSSLRKAWETVKDPKNFAYTEKHITIKGVDITPELDKAMSFWSEKDYTGFGQQIGIMYYRVLTKTGVKGAAAVAVEEPALLIA